MGNSSGVFGDGVGARRKIVTFMAALLLAALAAVTLHSRKAEATFPGAPGVIVFEGDDGEPFGGFSLFAVDRNGNHLRRLTDRNEFGWSQPNFSADGRRFLTSGGGYAVQLVRVDGSGGRTIINLPGMDYDPVYFPGARRLVFVHDTVERFGSGDSQVDLYTVNIDGSGLRRLTRTPDIIESDPSVSPDGRQVVFAAADSESDPYSSDWDVWSIRSDGRGLRNLTARLPGVQATPDFAPSGGRIAFTSGQESHFDPGLRTMVMRPDGSRKRPVRQPAGRTVDGSLLGWVPTGRGFLYELNGDLYIRGLGGKNLKLIKTPYYVGVGAWQPLRTARP